MENKSCLKPIRSILDIFVKRTRKEETVDSVPVDLVYPKVHYDNNCFKSKNIANMIFLKNLDMRKYLIMIFMEIVFLSKELVKKNSFIRTSPKEIETTGIKIIWNTFHSNLNGDNQNYDLVLYLLDFQWSYFGTVPSFFKYMIEVFKNVWWFEWEDRLSIEEDRLSIE